MPIPDDLLINISSDPLDLTELKKSKYFAQGRQAPYIIFGETSIFNHPAKGLRPLQIDKEIAQYEDFSELPAHSIVRTFFYPESKYNNDTWSYEKDAAFYAAGISTKRTFQLKSAISELAGTETKRNTVFRQGLTEILEPLKKELTSKNPNLATTIEETKTNLLLLLNGDYKGKYGKLNSRASVTVDELLWLLDNNYAPEYFNAFKATEIVFAPTESTPEEPIMNNYRPITKPLLAQLDQIKTLENLEQLEKTILDRLDKRLSKIENYRKTLSKDIRPQNPYSQGTKQTSRDRRYSSASSGRHSPSWGRKGSSASWRNGPTPTKESDSTSWRTKPKESDRSSWRKDPTPSKSDSTTPPKDNHQKGPEKDKGPKK